MKRGPLPFLTPLGLASAAAAIGAIALAWTLTGGAIAMPGPLNAENDDNEVHGGVHRHSEIDCGRCHTGVGGGTMSARCLSCHDDIRGQITAQSPLHGRLPEATACLRCHTEHVDGEITRVDRRTFPHDATGFALTAHQKRRDGARFDCDDCHTGDDVLHFAADRCAACHRDDPGNFLPAHTAAYGDTCRDCHDGVDRFSTGKFDHATTHFALEGKHVRVGCEKCHTGEHDLAALATAPTRCIGCHAKDDVHHGDNGDDCARCHTPDGWKLAKEAPPPVTPTRPKSPGQPAAEQAPADHRFPLDHGGGGRVACATCHPHGDDTYTCFGCHEHTPNNVLRIHSPRGIDDTHDCAHCHPTGRRR